ncbi:hypothetical protein E4U53_006279 [Claviceps sorghi]|nr:hypothetical protein E4U53_006279 [Claviceps sorghi]
MKYITLLFAAATAASAATLESRLNLQAWCGTPIPPSDDCTGFTTYCCRAQQGDYFRFRRNLLVTFKVPCEGSGIVYCG